MYLHVHCTVYTCNACSFGIQCILQIFNWLGFSVSFMDHSKWKRQKEREKNWISNDLINCNFSRLMELSSSNDRHYAKACLHINTVFVKCTANWNPNKSQMNINLPINNEWLSSELAKRIIALAASIFVSFSNNNTKIGYQIICA